MFRHIVLLTLDPTAATARRDEIIDALTALPTAIPEISSYRVGADAGLAAGNADIGVVADFATQADYETYRDHPAHRAVIERLIAPVLVARAAMQIAG
ncbi:MAG TPA: Dabb family protein [Microthrixaceae bacterium]|nr:Dabb family protein [Microthrixaceae bacterium]HNI36323.1 Dabb family protein [Microthrixaceae bacterium]